MCSRECGSEYKKIAQFSRFFGYDHSEPFKEEQLVLFQYLLNCSVRDPYYIALHVFTDLPLQGHSVKTLKQFSLFLNTHLQYGRAQLKAGRRVEPIFPSSSGFQIDYYRHNGYIQRNKNLLVFPRSFFFHFAKYLNSIKSYKNIFPN